MCPAGSENSAGSSIAIDVLPRDAEIYDMLGGGVGARLAAVKLCHLSGNIILVVDAQRYAPRWRAPAFRDDLGIGTGGPLRQASCPLAQPVVHTRNHFSMRRALAQVDVFERIVLHVEKLRTHSFRVHEFPPLVRNRRVNGDVLEFEMTEGEIRDLSTRSHWDVYGRCVDGELKGQQLPQVQSYQQFLRAWISFRKQTTFYAF